MRPHKLSNINFPESIILHLDCQVPNFQSHTKSVFFRFFAIFQAPKSSVKPPFFTSRYIIQNISAWPTAGVINLTQVSSETSSRVIRQKKAARLCPVLLAKLTGSYPACLAQTRAGCFSKAGRAKPFPRVPRGQPHRRAGRAQRRANVPSNSGSVSKGTAVECIGTSSTAHACHSLTDMVSTCHVTKDTPPTPSLRQTLLFGTCKFNFYLAEKTKTSYQ